MTGVPMKSLSTTILLAATLAGGPVTAEVTDAATGGFTSVNEVIIEANRADAWRAAINDIGQWWSSAHTISGDASRLSIDAKPQGCFCETLGDTAGVVHLTVTMMNPGDEVRIGTTLLQLEEIDALDVCTNPTVKIRILIPE